MEILDRNRSPLIPDSFELFGETYSVVFNDVLCNKQDAHGITEYSTNRIYLTSTYNGEDIPTDSIENTFWHEVIHVILRRLGYKDINDDENKVSALGSALHQVIMSTK